MCFVVLYHRFNIYRWLKICCHGLLWIRANVSLIRIHVTGRGHLAGKSPGPFYTKLKSLDRKQQMSERGPGCIPEVCKFFELTYRVASKIIWRKKLTKMQPHWQKGDLKQKCWCWWFQFSEATFQGFAQLKWQIQDAQCQIESELRAW